mgnify:CR=1 FL=1
MDSIVLTGPTSYLGTEILKKLILNYNVIGISRSASQLLSLFKKSPSKGIYVPLDIDLAQEESSIIISLIKDKLIELRSKPIGLVNNALTSFPSSALAIDKQSVQDSAEGILGLQIRLALEFANLIKDCNKGSIVNITSMYGKVSPRPRMYETLEEISPILYGSQKAALIQSTKYLSMMLASRNIRVNSVSFGAFPSEKIQNRNPDFIKRLASNTHLKRIGQASEAGGIIEFLLSESSSYITGADIPVDGGWTSW